MEELSNTVKSRYFIVLIILLIISIAGAAFGIRFLLSNEQGIVGQCGQGDTRIDLGLDISKLREVSQDFPWWHDEFSYYKQITIANANSKSSLQTDCWISHEFDHSYFVDQKKSRPDGKDLKFLYFEDGKYREIPFELSSPNTKETNMTFRLEKELSSRETDNSYILYYGNAVVESNDSILEETSDKVEASNYEIFRTREIHPKILGKVNRQWILKETAISSPYLKLTYTADIDFSIKPDSPPEYEIIGTTKKGNLQMNLEGRYEAEIDTSDLAIGRYQVQSKVIGGGTTHLSTKAGFFLSFPLYVTMTIDWEGVDTEDIQLDELLNFSQRHHNLPLTHFFNPRIYVTNEISKERADYLTQWIQVRKINRDEVGMHLHMHHDMIQAAGVGVKTSPKWTNYLNNGHDVPCSTYSYEEFMQILAWAKNEFLIQGLGVPRSFRAGGWFADLDVLRALNDSGFIIDSSGREAYTWGQNRLKGYWNLSSTTRPYHPSVSNQNVSSQPTLTLWEFPNNGADSYFYKAEDLIKRFNDNYNGQPLTQPQTITYLSHPHAFSQDLDVLDPTFDLIDFHLSNEDSGPVLYVTLEQAYEDFYKTH